MKVYLTARDTLQVLTMARQVREMDDVTHVVIVDCESTYQPLLDGLQELSREGFHIVHRPNLGPRAAWEVMPNLNEPYVVSDGDLDLSGCSKSMLTDMRQRLMRSTTLLKVGCSLRIDDLPDTEIGRKALNHESKFWSESPLDGRWHPADIDTTLAVYCWPTWGGYGPSERDGLNQARHVAWYLDPSNLPEDWRHYVSRVTPERPTHWSSQIAERRAK